MKTPNFRDLAFVIALSMLFALKFVAIGAALSAIAFSMAVHFAPAAAPTLPLRLFLSVPALLWLTGTIWFVRNGLRLLRGDDDAPGGGDSRPDAGFRTAAPSDPTPAPHLPRVLSRILSAVENWPGINLGIVALSGRNRIRRRERDGGWLIRLAGPGRMSPPPPDRKRLLVYLPCQGASMR